MCNHRSSYKNNLEKHIKNVHSGAKAAQQQQQQQQQLQIQQPQPIL